MDKTPDHNKVSTGQGDQPGEKSKRKVFRSDRLPKKPTNDSTNPDIEDLSNSFRQLHVQSTESNPSRSKIISYENEPPSSIGQAAMDGIINMVNRQQTTHARTEAFQRQEQNPLKRPMSSDSEEEYEASDIPKTSKRQRQTEAFQQQEQNPLKRPMSSNSEEEHEVELNTSKRQKQKESEDPMDQD